MDVSVSVSVQSLSRVRLFMIPWTTACQPPCPSPTPRVYSNSSPLSRWCHPAISSSVVPFSSCLQLFPASGFFPMSPFLASGDKNIGVSTSASVLPVNIQDWFPLLSQSVIIRNILNLVFINYTSDFSAFYWTKLLFIFEFLWPMTLSVKSHLLILTYVNILLKFCPNYRVLNLNSKLYD